MPNHFHFIPRVRFRLFVRAGRRVAAAMLAVGLAAILAGILAANWAAPLGAQTPTTPAEAYGPFNAVFLADGSGLNKTLSPSTSLDGIWAVAMDGQGSGQPSIQDPVLAGRAVWTLSFWFESQVPIQGAALLAGMGDPAAEDARFIGIADNRLGLWLGKAQSSAGFVAGDQALDAAKWHLAVAVSDGDHRGALRRWPRSGHEQVGAGQRCAGSGDGAAAAAECRGEPFWRRDCRAQNLSHGVDGGASEGDCRCAAGL